MYSSMIFMTYYHKQKQMTILEFALYVVQGVLGHSCLVNDNLLGWHNSIVGKRRNKALKAAPS